MLLVLVSPVVYSYTAILHKPSSLPIWPHSVERFRQHHGNWFVDEAEHYYYYGWKAPNHGGPQLKSVPTVGVTSAAIVKTIVRRRHRRIVAVAPTMLPPAVKLAFAHRLAGEGIWRGAGPVLRGRPPVLVTTFRTELDYPRILAYVAWFDQTRTPRAHRWRSHGAQSSGTEVLQPCTNTTMTRTWSFGRISHT